MTTFEKSAMTDEEIIAKAFFVTAAVVDDDPPPAFMLTDNKTAMALYLALRHPDLLAPGEADAMRLMLADHFSHWCQKHPVSAEVLGAV